MSKQLRLLHIIEFIPPQTTFARCISTNCAWRQKLQHGILTDCNQRANGIGHILAETTERNRALKQLPVDTLGALKNCQGRTQVARALLFAYAHQRSNDSRKCQLGVQNK